MGSADWRPHTRIKNKKRNGMKSYIYFRFVLFLLFAHPSSAREPPSLRKNFWHGWILCRCKSYSLQLICLLSEYCLRCAEEQSCFFSLPNWASPQIQMWAAGPVQCLHKHLKCLSHGTQSLNSFVFVREWKQRCASLSPIHSNTPNMNMIFSFI